MSTAAVYRHLGVFLFLSPLCALQNLDLESSSVSTQILFVTSRALGSVKSIVLDRHEMFIRGVVRALMSDPSLGVAGAFLVAGDRPRYVPPPYLETFFDAGVPHLALRR
ncbi:hypothetical protein B0H16DRAFT_342574 [Mycena metata]|uniref:Secreted protein n=1 Tax=Mycena metata TaxID=1033252 RepID=A0AAD7HMH4_9AGAR|nr:hypothetical protein B0H16DRAFT_342574 [Mycena metata]